MRAVAARVAEGYRQRDRVSFDARDVGRLQVDRADGVHGECEHRVRAVGQRLAVDVERRVLRVAAQHAQRIRTVRQRPTAPRNHRRPRRRVVADFGQRHDDVIAAACLEQAVLPGFDQPIRRRVGYRVVRDRTRVPHGL